MTMELKEHNSLCKHIKNVGSSQRTARQISVFKTIFKDTFCQWVNQKHVKLDNIVFWKLHVFKINMIFFITI